MANANLIPKHFVVTLGQDEMLDLILGLRQYLREFPDGTYVIGEILTALEKAYGHENLPQQEEKDEPARGDTEGGTETDGMGGTTTPENRHQG